MLEETGADLVTGPAPPLVSVDVHGIPPKRSEPYHLHHDLIFLLRARRDAARLAGESRAVAWCAPAELDRCFLSVFRSSGDPYSTLLHARRMLPGMPYVAPGSGRWRRRSHPED